jgi:hypothetical protein
LDGGKLRDYFLDKLLVNHPIIDPFGFVMVWTLECIKLNGPKTSDDAAYVFSLDTFDPFTYFSSLQEVSLTWFCMLWIDDNLRGTIKY